jgi:cytochrome c peroxidase
MCSSTPRSVACCALAASLAFVCCSESPSDEGDPVRAAEALESRWSDSELALMRSLWIGSLPDLAPSASNKVADEPRAARLGHALFFDSNLSADASVSCATCHMAARHFTDGLVRSVGIGTAGRNAPSVVGAAHAPWQFWDGRRDSLWSQALAPLEAGVEMGSTRLEVVRYVTGNPRYRDAYTELFGAAPDLGPGSALPERAGPFAGGEAKAAWQRLPSEVRQRVNRGFANVGKAIEAYERRLRPGPSRFDRYAESVFEAGAAQATLLDANESAGLRLFLDMERTQCLRCHNGPLLTNQSFHNVGTARGGEMDFGRFLGIQSVLLDPFNCLGPFSDAETGSCGELEFVDGRNVEHLTGAFKTPSLREVARTGPYMHDGSFATLSSVIEHYRRPPPVEGTGHELTPLDLTDEEAAQLVTFLGALDGGIDAEPHWLAAPAPSLAP